MWRKELKNVIRFFLPFLIVFLGFFCFALFINLTPEEGQSNDNLLFFCICFPVWIICIVAFVLIKKRDKELAKKEQQEYQEFIDTLNSATLSDLPIIQKPQGILLSEDEVCYWQCPATYLETKTVTTGYQHHSTGASVRIAKGLSIHSSGGRSTAIRQNVTTRYSGRLSITSKRIIMESEKGGFDKPFSKITSVSSGFNNLLVQSGSTQYSIQIQYPEIVIRLIELVRK